MSLRPFLARGHASLAARLVLGAVFLWLGAAKALDPAAFLKLVRQFDLLASPLALNLVGALLPWSEIVFGLLLIAGVLARGAALAALLLLVAFTGAIAARAVALHGATGAAFCSLRFDCGCGTGEVYVCAKLAENTALCALALVVLLAPAHRFPFRARP